MCLLHLVYPILTEKLPCVKGKGRFRSPAGREFRPAGRDTFGRGPKSVQKGHLNLRFKNPPALFCVQDRDCLPHVHVRCSFSIRQRIVLSPAPLPLMLMSNNAAGSTVEKMSGSGARGTDDTSYDTKSNIPCERVVKGRRSAK